MSRVRYKPLFLFVVALILPSVVIVVLGWRNFAQERELAEKRLMDAEKHATAEIRQRVLERLERIKLQEIVEAPTFSDPAVVLIGWVDRDRLLLPWDIEPANRARQSVDNAEASRKIDEAERAELVDKRFDQAAGLYRESIEAARASGNSIQVVKARLGLARTLAQSGGDAEALSIYRDVLRLPAKTVDSNGIPFASLAAKRLVDMHGADREVLDRMASELESPNALTPSWNYVLKVILQTLTKSSDSEVSRDAERALAQLSARERYLEQAVAFKSDFLNLHLTPNDWRLYSPPGSSGDDAWLVGMTLAKSETKPLVIAVRAGDIFKSVQSDRLLSGAGLDFELTAGGKSGEPLGENLPGLRVTFRVPADADANPGLNLKGSFYVLSLLVVVGVTFLGGCLLLRDTRREVRMAEMRSQFVSSVSHELKTPLTSIRMFAETLQMNEETGPQMRAEYLDTIVNETERLTRLLNNVLDFSRMERGQKNYHMELAPLPEVLDAAVRTMQFPLAQQGFNLHVKVDGVIPPLHVDRDAIEQAVLNLLSNAIKYAGQSRDIELRLCSQNGSALVQVTDHGIGIPADEQRRIFEKFYRVPTPENRAISGTGLGLALVAHVAEAHGGSVEVESKPEGGSTFSIRLPLNRNLKGMEAS